MKVVRAAAELRSVLEAPKRAARSVGLVPTMGALHEGHLSLVREARRSNDTVVVSIFVNPLQFGPSEDFRSYPRDEAADVVAADAEGVDLVFAPSVDEMYPPGRSTIVGSGPLGTVLEGASRPGHFDGVCTVVAKLFNLVEPDVAYFGQKDVQQVAVIKRMVTDLSYRVRVVVCPTVREKDGLALSSRNSYLSSEERQRARALFRALDAGRRSIATGENGRVAEVAMADVVAAEKGVELDYARAVEPESFDEPHPDGPVLLVIAASVGQTRLIDNLHVDPRDDRSARVVS
jgi:pantoate--beta-alanine ligase